MIRKIIKIDEEKCNGCGLCANACHENAIAMQNGKAKLIRDDYCDGLGDCLPACPTNAISFEEREAAEYDEASVKAHQANLQQQKSPCSGGGCPGSRAKTITRSAVLDEPVASSSNVESQLMQWPVQIKLLPLSAPYYENANLLVAADCSAYAYADFHNSFIKNHITMIGCPKLDEGSYAEKLTEILKRNNIKSVTVVRMEVPCCGGIENAVKEALMKCGKLIPWHVVTISTEGKILDE
ncbi:MAG TPA: 4Fe-4S binding protein [Oscillospiraceae bacterium]|nr:4Fe-4S binding protein [Oscillospiraceae bacterium]